MNRTQAREQAFILIFESAFQPQCQMQPLIDTFNEMAEENMGAEIQSRPVDKFAARLALGVEAHQEQCDQVIAQYAIGWKLNRIPKVTLSILRMALYEMDYAEEIPVSVTINEAVELAKKYSTKEDAAFINGVLGTYSRADKSKDAQ